MVALKESIFETAWLAEKPFYCCFYKDQQSLPGSRRQWKQASLYSSVSCRNEQMIFQGSVYGIHFRY